MTKQATKAQAERVRKQVAKMFGAEEGYGPKLLDKATYGNYGGPGWIISWEEGPYEWPFLFPDGGVDEELASMVREFVDSDADAGRQATRKGVELPKGIWTEAINHYSISVYRED